MVHSKRQPDDVMVCSSKPEVQFPLTAPLMDYDGVFEPIFYPFFRPVFVW